jgi:hypothetical protein
MISVAGKRPRPPRLLTRRDSATLPDGEHQSVSSASPNPAVRSWVTQHRHQLPDHYIVRPVHSTHTLVPPLSERAPSQSIVIAHLLLVLVERGLEKCISLGQPTHTHIQTPVCAYAGDEGIVCSGCNPGAFIQEGVRWVPDEIYWCTDSTWSSCKAKSRMLSTSGCTAVQGLLSAIIAID